MTVRERGRLAVGLRWAWPWLLAAGVSAPAICGWLPFAPAELFSGFVTGTARTYLAGWPWIDGNVGVTTEALGHLAAVQWLHGIVPYWNHFSGVGLPLAAEGQTTAMFLPFGLLLALPHGMLLLRIVLLGLAGTFAQALLRRLKLDGVAGVAGAALFELNLTFAWYFHGPAMPVAFLPLLLLGLERARDGVFPLSAALGTAWTFLAGFPETAALNFAFAGAWGALRLAGETRRARYVWNAGGSVLAGLLLAAPSIWPFVEALPREFLGAHTQPIHGWLPSRLGLMLFPYSQGPVLANVLDGSDAGGGWFQVGGGIPFLIGAVALAALRLRAPEAPLRFLLAGWVLLTGARIVSFGWANWLFDRIPLVRLAAVGLYVMPSWSMAASVLVACALADWRGGRRPNWLLALAIMLPAGAAAVVWSEKLIAGAPRWLAVPAIVLPALLLALLVLITRGGATAARLRWAAAVLVGYATMVFMVPPLASPRGVKLDRAAIAFLAAHTGLGRVASFGPLWANYGAMFGIASINHNYLPLPANWVAEVDRRFAPRDKVTFSFNPPYSDAALRRMLPDLEDLGVADVLTMPWATLPAWFGGAAPVYRDRAVAVWQLPHALPYVSAPGCTLVSWGRDDLTADCGAPAWLLRRELFWPGWRARVGGVVTKPVQDGIFQRVALPAGVTRVRFFYAPPGMGAAWAGCFAGLVLVLGGVLGAARRSAAFRVRGRFH